MANFVLGVFEITIGMSLFIALLLLGLKVFGGKFTAKCRYIIWALVMLRLAIPFSFGLLPTLIEIPIETALVQNEDVPSAPSENTAPITQNQPSDPGDIIVNPTVPSTPAIPTVPSGPNTDPSNPGNAPTLPTDQTEPVIPEEPIIEPPAEQPTLLKQILDIAGIVYLAGVVVFFVWNLSAYVLYTRKILRSAKAVDNRTQQIFSVICKKYGIKKQPTLLVASGIHSPAAFGIFHRRIVLPDIAFTENGLVGTLAHEVTHCKRGDLYMKLAELIACSLNWFNPLVHIAAFQCEMEMELSCDEKVLSGSSDAARAAYADVMLDIIQRCRRNRGALTTHFNPKKSAVTARFKNILYGSGKRRGRILIGVCLVLCVLAGAIVACQTEDDLPDDIDYAEGIYIKDIAGADMVLIDGTSPCTFWGADGVVIEGVTDGDRIRIGVREFLDSSPMQAEVYSIEKLSDGTIDDIDPAVLDSLRELGWINADNSVVNYGHGPFIGYVNDKESPWIDLYTELNGTYVGRIPYEIFNGWPATDRNSEGWTPGWEPEYLKYYYAEFDDFRWAAVHLEGTVLGSGRVNVATSSDGGKTWTCGNYTDDYGGNHVTGIGFESAKIAVMCFDSMYEHDLFTEEGMTLPVVLSRTEDGGKTWKRMEIAVPDGWGNYQTRPSVPVFDSPSGRIPVTRYDKTTGTEVDTVYLVTSIAGLTWEWEDIVPENNFNPDTFFGASNPNMRADLLFWHRMFPAADNTYLYFCAIRNLNSTMTSYTDDPPKEFMIYWTKNGENFMAAEAKLPDDLQYDSVCPVVVTDNGGGSGETEFIVQLTHGEKIFYASFDNFTWGDAHDAFTFMYRGILSDDEVNELKAQYPDAFRKAEKFYWNFTLVDFKNENPGNSFVYEGYTVEYECASPYGGTFDFHIHLPQLNSNSLYAEKWNYIYQEYEVEFGDLLRKTVHGTNTDHYLNITYNTVTTGDVLTIYIIKSHGILASGAYTRDYDIFHYNMKTDRLLSTDEFLAYYAEGQFADYTVAKMVEFMNEIGVNTDELGGPLPLTEKDIIGVIPSVFGDGKFDVVYHGYSLEGSQATRMLFSPYPIYGSPHQYTYRLTYHDYVSCEEWKMYGQPAGYRLLLSQRKAEEFDAGYYVDCIFTEDIAEPPESYSLSEHGGYYTPVGEDPYGNMCIFIDHETAAGHLNAVIPFDMPVAAQDYYRGLHKGYFSYDRVLGGSNYTVNENIASQAAQVLDAYRNGKDPNELFPASKTEYTSYPLESIRENPTANEIGEILKNTPMSEDGTIHFDLDLGSGWVMSLPIDIGGFGESVQAYFTGVWFAHGTPKEEEDIEWTQYSETRTGEDGKIYQISFVLPVEWMHDSGGILNDVNGNKRIGSRFIAVDISKEDFASSLEEMAERYHVDLDSPLTGTSDSGISYMGYCFEGEREIPGDITGRYLYRFAYSDSISMHMDVWKRNAYDDDSFYEQYVLPIIQSVTIEEKSTNAVFTSILENKRQFQMASTKESMLLSEYKAKTDYSVKKYTILDLNDDRDPEMVLWLGYGTNEYAGFLVLHRDSDTVYAHGFPYRGFNGLNGAGVYTSSSSAFNMSILKLDFDGDTCTETVLARREGDGSAESVTYYIEDRIGTAEEFENYWKRYNSRSIPDWYSYDIDEITDIDDWRTLLWAESLPPTEMREPSQNVYSFIRDLVKGESDIPEINGLGIKEYSIALLKESDYDSLFRFTFTVTGNSLPETLLPGTYTWTLLDGVELSIYTEGVPTTQEESEAYWKRMRGLDRFEGNSAVEAVNTYLSWMPYIYEVSPYGEWNMENYHLPYNYICAYYGNEGLEISFNELQSLMSDKFGIALERPDENRLLSRCEYNKERDTVRYADTRGYEAVHRFLDIRKEDGITYVIVQLFADRYRMIPSHKIEYAIGEGEVFLGCEIIQTGNYLPRVLS